MPSIELTIHQYQELVRAAYSLAAMQATVAAELKPEYNNAQDDTAWRLLDHVVARGARFGFPGAKQDVDAWPEWTMPLFNDAKGYLSDYVQLRMRERLADGLATQHYRRFHAASNDTPEQRRVKVREIADRIIQVLESNRDPSSVVIKGVTDSVA